MTSKHKTQDTDQGAAGGGMQEGQEVKLYTRPSDLQTAPALEKRVRDLEAALRRIRDSTHKTAVVLRGIANDALGSKT